jgi:ferric-dicitrate binding protein FerR (iron transport regulator)
VENTKQRLERLLQSENWSDDDRIWLRQYLNSKDFNELRAVALEQYNLDLTELKSFLDGKLSNQILNNIHQNIKLNQPTSYIKIVTLKRGITAAAVIFIVLTCGIYFYLNKPINSQIAIQKSQPKKNDIAPGSNKAILTLADGSKISLSDVANGEIAKQAGISITKTSNGQLIYSIADSQPVEGVSQLEVYNTIETPKGGQYQINLPDGSKVWLNAASSLRFPTKFKGKERKVELSGEAYFEIAHITLISQESRTGAKIESGAEGMPFKVISGNQIVEVLGTHFNINAYSDEPSIRTTLLEGSVRVSLNSPSGEGLDKNFSKLLMPGQQSKVNKMIKVFNVDTQEAIAWKNGYFMFNNENIESVMRKVSRWYNVDIEYQGNISQKALWGSLSRFKNLSELTDMLELTGSVHFKIVPGDTSEKERRIIVMP